MCFKVLTNYSISLDIKLLFLVLEYQKKSNYQEYLVELKKMSINLFNSDYKSFTTK